MAITTITTMAFSLFTSSVYLFLFLSPSLAIPSSSSSSSNTDICSSTPFPRYCKSLLNNKSASVQDLARFSIHQSFAKTRDYLSLVNRIFGTMNVIPVSTFVALQDCQLLLELNIDFLSNAMQAVNSKYALKLSQIDDQHTKLSAALTNLETCMDGLLESNSNSISEIAKPKRIQDETITYVISLALFNKGWVSDKRKRTQLANKRSHKLVINKGRKVPGFENLRFSNEITVAQDGSGNFTTINDAVEAAPDWWHGGDGYFVIRVMAGVYNEAVYVSKKKNYIMMIGEGINKTIITGNRSVGDEYQYSTFSSATFSLFGTGFVGMNLTIRNTAGANKHPAVALQNSGDKSTFYKCSFEGYKNTLYAYSQRQFYKTCDIYGTTDFMFGAATAVFQNCNIFARLPMKNQFNVITAQGRSRVDQKSGFSIQNCTIALAPHLATDTRTMKMYLGRPWRPYSRTVFMESYIGGLVDPLGWKVLAKDYAVDTLYYGEFSNYGPGSNTSGRVTWPGYHVINSSDVAVEYTVSRFIFGDEWLPATKVPYNAGFA